MAQFWVANPGDQGRLAGLEAEAARLQHELSEITGLGDVQACRVCGEWAELTAEHAPSKSAGNVGKMIRKMIDDELSLATGRVEWTEEAIQGSRVGSLCGSCNNKTGSWYTPSYVQFCWASRVLARPENAGKVCQVTVSLHRPRVVKQALTWLIATSQPGLTALYPELRALLLGREERRPLTPVRLGLYLMANPGVGMSTGITVAMNIEQRQGCLVAAFSSWPLGWLMVIGGELGEQVADVSGWTELDVKDRSPATVEVPCQWTLSPYPGDFRGPQELPPEAWTAQGLS